MSIDTITALRLLHEQAGDAAGAVLGQAIAEMADLRQWREEAALVLEKALHNGSIDRTLAASLLEQAERAS